MVGSASAGPLEDKVPRQAANDLRQTPERERR